MKYTRLKKPQVLALREEVRQAIATLGRCTRKQINAVIGTDRFTCAQIRQQIENLCANGLILSKDKKNNGTRAVFYWINPHPEKPREKKPKPPAKVVQRYMQHIEDANGKTWRRTYNGQEPPYGARVAITNVYGRIIGRVPYMANDREQRIKSIIRHAKGVKK